MFHLGVPALRYSKLTKPALKKRRKMEKAKQAVPRKSELCSFFTRHGKCHNYSKCPFIHDPEKVAICSQFLNGECFDTSCLLRHKLDHLTNRMPVCVHFLKGACSNANCPYLHVKVSDDAQICPEFARGFCPRGPTC